MFRSLGFGRNMKISVFITGKINALAESQFTPKLLNL